MQGLHASAMLKVIVPVGAGVHGPPADRAAVFRAAAGAPGGGGGAAAAPAGGRGSSAQLESGTGEQLSSSRQVTPHPRRRSPLVRGARLYTLAHVSPVTKCVPGPCTRAHQLHNWRSLAKRSRTSLHLPGTAVHLCSCISTWAAPYGTAGCLLSTRFNPQQLSTCASRHPNLPWPTPSLCPSPFSCRCASPPSRAHLPNSHSPNTPCLISAQALACYNLPSPPSTPPTGSHLAPRLPD